MIKDKAHIYSCSLAFERVNRILDELGYKHEDWKECSGSEAWMAQFESVWNETLSYYIVQSYYNPDHWKLLIYEHSDGLSEIYSFFLDKTPQENVDLIIMERL